MGPVPAVAAVRLAVRRALADLEPGSLVLVACSGGADSLALAAAAAFEAGIGGPADAGRGGRIRVGAVTVDHGLQAGSAERAATVAGWLGALGLDPVRVAPVTVGTVGGPEAAARTARYAALDAAAESLGAAAVLLGHTRDDQAETVLLGLARGAGARSLAGMRPVHGRYRRPLLELNRELTRAACLAEGLTPWDDPHNDDDAFTRVRVRRDVLPVLTRALGPGVVAALARTADLLRDDADALDAWAERELVACRLPADPPAAAGPGGPAGAPGTAGIAGVAGPGGGLEVVQLDVVRLAVLPDAVRRRVLHQAAVAAGSPRGALAAVHVGALDGLVTGWHGQGPAQLPGGVSAERRCGRLLLGRRSR